MKKNRLEIVEQRRKDLNKRSKLEILLSQKISNLGVKFRRNRPVWAGLKNRPKWKCYIDIYIFYPKNVAIEIDGPEHDEVKDKKREAMILANYPTLKFLRFKNDEIRNDLEAVIEKIKQFLKS